ncbi:sigma 54-interacting transcriptional regulator, partial [Cronobacter turicensis]
QRVGEDKLLRVDVRIVAATNRDLREAVAQGGFRADLYHRLSVFPLHVPALRERGDDILLLAGYFCEKCRVKFGLNRVALSPQASEWLMAQRWPGNIRELEHALYRAIIVAQAASRGPELLLQAHHFAPGASVVAPRETPVAAAPPVENLQHVTRQFQRDYIQRALQVAGNNWAACARLLEMDPGNLHRLARKLGLK